MIVIIINETATTTELKERRKEKPGSWKINGLQYRALDPLTYTISPAVPSFL